MARHNSAALLLALLLSALLAAADYVAGDDQRLREARQCRMQRIAARRPSRRVESEGGVTELWDDHEEQFQCAGLSALRKTIQPECMAVPNYSPSPRLVYVQRGQGLMGIVHPGCPEAFRSGEPTLAMRTEEGEQMSDQHQKVHRIRQGDLVSIPAGAAHWCYNDGSEELVFFSVADLLSQSNQLDPTDRYTFFLAGGRRTQQEASANVLQALDAGMIAEAFGISMELARKMQREDERGTIVRVRQGAMRLVRPSAAMEEKLGAAPGCSPRRREGGANGMEEAFCNMKVRHNLDNSQAAPDVYSKQAGRLYSVNMHKLPILQFIGMSAERASFRPNVMFGPGWSVNAHTLVYITRGQGRTQIVSGQGKTLFDGNVRQGDVFVVPQFMASMHVAGDSGVEWVAFKTSPSPVRSPLVGRTSVFRGMPSEVIANAYRMSYNQAQQLKYGREEQINTPRRTTTRMMEGAELSA